ncbi:unnamed protein product [Mytilus coruscus]|uniref:HSPA12A n=1 Tax=Mytilus coruscus TaxID=42192 RepID=A0A6J8DAX5_MYTCO|nr:unnamed protein product [Mytilus coruscus]
MAGMFVEDDTIIVAAIDFGTTYSGWAFSFRDRYQNDPLDIQTHSGWKSGDGLTTPKVPTCILFDKDGHFCSFGYEAERMYAELLEEDSADGWKFFSRFKMCLFRDDDGLAQCHSALRIESRRILNRFKLKDVNGNKMLALTVFSESLKFLKNNFMKLLEMRIPSVPMHYISWVLTVPAIWTDKAKEFMRLAALEAGIPGARLSLAYEPEAAALFCKKFNCQTKGPNIQSAFDAGESFLVLDCGGGTVDITTYQITENGKMREVHHPTGGPWGGMMVDGAFLEFMEGIFGTSVWLHFVRNNIEDYLELKWHFEAKKRTVGEQNKRKDEKIKIPQSLFDIYEEINHKKFDNVGGVVRAKDKIKFSTEIMVKLFDETTSIIADHLYKLLKYPALSNIRTVLMVGGFSDCILLCDKVKKYLSDMPISVICPDDAVLSVVKGAVIFGNSRELIQERVCPRTYGIACNVPYDSEQPYISLQNYDGQTVSTNVFKTLYDSKVSNTKLLSTHVTLDIRILEISNMSTENSNVNEYTLELQDYSTLDTKGDADDDVSSIDEFEDAVEYLEDTDTLLSALELENLIEAVDGINSVTNISMPIDTSEVSNTLQYDDIEVSSSLDDLEIPKQPTCTEDGNVVVVAIDFGTTYSGWAFSLLKKFKDDKLDIQTNNGWKSGDGLVTPKVPTCILYNENEEFNSFGYEAESRYAELIDDNRAGDWRYFSRFKMSLFCDDNAGIPGTQLTLAYEPEAAALYCRESTYQRKGQLIGPISAFGTGESLLILDCGGGTIDITTYEIMTNGRLKELHEPTGGPWGGTIVDKAFMKFIEDIFGIEVWEKYKHEYKVEVLDIQRHFELKKRTVGESSERSELFLQFPRSLFDKYEEFYSKPFTTENGVSRHRDKLRIPRENIISLFDESTTAIINHTRELLQRPCLVKVKTILLIGGFSDSAILRNKVIKEFSEMTVMCPDDAVLSVVKGAVIFGNTPGLIQERVSPLTYGIACNVPFDADKHPKPLLKYCDNRALCSCVFQVLVRKGDTVIIGKNDFETIFHPTRAHDRKATICVYTSTENDPMYTFGPYVQELGILELDIPDTGLGKFREIKVCLIFKSTELTVIAKEGDNLVSGKFNCLG